MLRELGVRSPLHQLDPPVFCSSFVAIVTGEWRIPTGAERVQPRDSDRKLSRQLSDDTRGLAAAQVQIVLGAALSCVRLSTTTPTPWFDARCRGEPCTWYSFQILVGGKS
jgi:hypothetical protein